MPKPRTGTGKRQRNAPSPEPGTTRRTIRLPNYIDRELSAIADRKGMFYSQVLKSLYDQARGARLPITLAE